MNNPMALLYCLVERGSPRSTLNGSHKKDAAELSIDLRVRCRSMKTVKLPVLRDGDGHRNAHRFGWHRRRAAAAAAAEVSAAVRVRLRHARRRSGPIQLEARGDGDDRHVGRLLSRGASERHVDLGY